MFMLLSAFVKITTVEPITTTMHQPVIIDLYYFNLSPPSRAVYMLTKALGLKANVKIINIFEGDQMKPEFLKLNPLHTIPVINDNGFILYESVAIMKYLVDQYAKDDTFYPRDPKRGAIVTQRVVFASTTLFQRFFEFHVPMMQTGSPDEEKQQKLEECLHILDSYVDGRTWLAGSDLTVADFSAVTIISNMDAAGAIDLDAYPNVMNWYQRCKDQMFSYGFSENQSGSQQFGHIFKAKTNK